jgi:hypothetical protein
MQPKNMRQVENMLNVLRGEGFEIVAGLHTTNNFHNVPVGTLASFSAMHSD